MKKEIALAISGGGYRATLFALGSLWRLNKFGLLPRIDRLTSVSGGSITSAYLAMKWNDLHFDPNTLVADNFEETIAEPIRRFCSRTLDVPAFIWGLLTFGRTGDRVAERYSKWLFGSKMLRDIPTPGQWPEFIFYSASLQTGASVRISKEYIEDYKVGRLPNPELSLARVVGASSAFPPFFSPVKLKCNPGGWQKTKGAFLYEKMDYRKKLVLTDGGVYDNMGLEAIWNDGFKTVFVCDAGTPWENKPKAPANWFSQLLRVNDTMGTQARALRKRILLDNFQERPAKYGGTYWGIGTQIDHYELTDAMVKDNETTECLQRIRTRLNKFSEEEQGKLINWGYALTDAALRKWYFKNNGNKGEWPVPEYALDK